VEFDKNFNENSTSRECGNMPNGLICRMTSLINL
jgi:hypothetical protein